MEFVSDAELARVIKTRMKQELANMPLVNPSQSQARQYIRDYMRELCDEIINENF